ncbi:MAG: CoA-binding protein, partial [Desulfobacterales bacterium]|nr:CoA-binding protein [Desulfobacterales bacterium]
KNMVLISSGFGETGEEGKEMERALVEKAREAGVLVLGPNTMGICNPHIRLNCTSLSVHPRPGSTAIVAQSGNMGVQLLAFAEAQGIGVRAFSGSGNEAMMTIEDYLDGLEADELTRTVMLYVESVKNGPRFFQSARRLGRKKPIVLLKGGRTSAGNKAAASHTGAMASDFRVFDAMCAQAGVVKVEHPMDLLDLAAAFSSLPLPKGNRAAIMTLGGGWGVVTADLCSEYGLEIPVLSPEILTRVDKLLPPYWSKANPIDLVGETDLSLFITVLEELMKWDGCDAVINLGIIGRSMYINRLVDSVLKAGSDYPPEFLQSLKESMAQFEVDYTDHAARMMETYNKPVFGVSLLTAENEGSVYRHENRRFKSIFYQTPERAVKAFARMYSYSRFLAR